MIVPIAFLQENTTTNRALQGIRDSVKIIANQLKIDSPMEDMKPEY